MPTRPREQGLGVFEFRLLPFGHGEALVQIPASLSESSLHGRDQPALTQGVRQVVRKGAGDFHGFLGDLACLIESAFRRCGVNSEIFAA